VSRRLREANVITGKNEMPFELYTSELKSRKEFDRTLPSAPWLWNTPSQEIFCKTSNVRIYMAFAVILSMIPGDNTKDPSSRSRSVVQQSRRRGRMSCS